jgi:hypothetical protein
MPEPGRSLLTVAELATHKRLPEQLLRDLGLYDMPGAGVAIPYRDDAGHRTVAVKQRTALAAKDGSFWPRGVPLSAYGLWRLGEARRRGYLFLVEGESDCWALWHHGEPALGLPGTGTAGKTLTAEALAGVARVYVSREPDKPDKRGVMHGGCDFIAGVERRLRELRYTGTAYELRWPAGVKDPADLHARDGTPAVFREALEQAVLKARRLGDPAPAPERNGSNGHVPAGAKREEEDADIPLPDPEPWPRPPSALAYSGLAGAIVQAIEPETEADPAAVLAQFLVMFGNAVGRQPYWKVEDDRHHANLFTCLVGDTAVGRKGTSKGRALAPFTVLDLEDRWCQERITGGLSSGEGLIDAVHDEARGEDGEVTRRGVADKRLLVVETEFAATLKVMKRDGNTLSPVIRQAWDTGDLGTLTKNNKSRATGAHVSIIGHVTRDELLATLADVEGSNGFANRFLWVAARRSKLLPLGGRPVRLGMLSSDLADAVRHAKTVWEVGLTQDAVALWCDELYPRLNDYGRGAVANALSRAAAQVRRLAMVYALTDCRTAVDAADLRAAAALWDYCERSVRWIFGESTGDRLADELLTILAGAGERGLTQTEIRDYFSRHARGAQLGKALATLLQGRQARFEEVPTGGRPTRRWYAARDQSDQSARSPAAAAQG